MDEEKITEVIKGLECCKSNYAMCGFCPYRFKFTEMLDCSYFLKKDALNLIKRLTRVSDNTK